MGHLDPDGLKEGWKGLSELRELLYVVHPMMNIFPEGSGEKLLGVRLSGNPKSLLVHSR